MDRKQTQHRPCFGVYHPEPSPQQRKVIIHFDGDQHRLDLAVYQADPENIHDFHDDIVSLCSGTVICIAKIDPDTLYMYIREPPEPVEYSTPVDDDMVSGFEKCGWRWG